MRRTWKLAAICVVMYVGSYMTLSRRGMAEARAYKGSGFCYFSPEDTDTWRAFNGTCVELFEPLNYFDVRLGTGMPAYSCVLFKLS